jgi:hypothetical protein
VHRSRHGTHCARAGAGRRGRDWHVITSGK